MPYRYSGRPAPTYPCKDHLGGSSTTTTQAGRLEFVSRTMIYWFNNTGCSLQPDNPGSKASPCDLGVLNSSVPQFPWL